MVIKKKKLFYDIGIRYVWILCIYVVMSISLNEIVVRGNDYIAQVTDSMLTGKPVVLQNILIQMSGMIIVGTVAAYFADLSRKYYRNLLGGLYRENPVKSRNYEAVKSSKKWENVGNSYIIPALLLYRYSYI
jgi:hypothetical protein